MKIAVIGSGAIGSLVAGYLKVKGEDVFLVGHPDSVKAINSNGLRISGVRGEFRIKVEAFEALSQKAGLAILAVKTQDIENVLIDNQRYLKDTLIISTQNGVSAESILAGHFSKAEIISSIVMFGSTCLKPSETMHNFEGKWILGKPFAENNDSLKDVVSVLSKAFPTVISDNIAGMKWLKLFLNANNCLPAIIGKSMQETFSSLELCSIAVMRWQEGLKIVNSSGVKLASLPDFPLERLTALAALPPEESAKVFSGIMRNLSKEPLYGSVLQSIMRGRSSEIDFINGEFVALARGHGMNAPLNERLVSLVHKVEKSRKFLTLDRLLEDIEGLSQDLSNPSHKTTAH